MRPLTTEELKAVSGGELQQYFEPPRSYNGGPAFLGFENNANGSSTIYLRNLSGQNVFSYNTGVGVACFMTSTGIGITVGTLSANALAGSIAAVLTSAGCTSLGSNAPQPYTDDGDGG